MRRLVKQKKLAMTATVLLAGGTVFQGTCANALFSLPICGAVLTFCTPGDQINVLWPLLTTPDFDADPTCTIPLGCLGTDENQVGNGFFDPGGTNLPGGDVPDQPMDDQQGIGGGGGGGGGGI